MQGRLSQEEQKEEEARHEAFTLKQRVVECEAAWEAALQEVRLWGGRGLGVYYSVLDTEVCVSWCLTLTTNTT